MNNDDNPELGFVNSEKEGTESQSTFPHLNAREEYTHVVDEETPTQVVKGGIQCALDGGTVEIGLYDITDGVKGAPRVFTQDVTLPERPTDGEDGYEVDTYIFDLDPVVLSDYAGRELAVAAKHDTTRIWGNNWYNPSGADFSRIDGDSLPDSWSGGLRDGYASRSMGLFVEPVDVPDGKKQTVVGSDSLADRSRTVFAVFPDHSPEPEPEPEPGQGQRQGMVVQYDEQTSAGASVTVRQNGVLSVGQGSTPTDSVAVSIRDSEGTWHGPRTITLTEGSGSDQVTVTATGGTISPGEQTTLSMTAESVDRVTINDLWTDWTVQVTDPVGATVQDSVSKTGELTLEWETVQSEVAPAISITPPADTYVGGTYAVDVVAVGDGDSGTDTALVEIESGSESSSGGQTASTDKTTSDSETTLVATRAPDGSRLTSRPDGPVYHTKDGTVHLFTWDEPAPGARAVLYDEDETTDWGDGPDIHLYDTMERPDATAGDVPSLQAPTGKWQLSHSDSPELRPNSHSGEFSARMQDQNDSSRFQTEFAETTEVFLSYCVKIPEGKAMPGTENPGEFPDASVWKMAWLFHEDTSDDVDICLPSWIGEGGFSIGGNSLDPNVDIVDDKTPNWWQWGEWLRFSIWLECGPDPTADDGRIRWQVVTEGDKTQVVADSEVPIMEDGDPPYAWQRLNVPGWARNKNVSGENVEALYDDIYIATGDDANARIELSDNVDYANSTRMQLCDIRSWSSNRVSARLRKGSLNAVENAVIHLTTAEERQAVSMEVN